MPVLVLSHFSCILLFLTSWTVAHRAPLQARIPEWVPLPSPGDLSDSWIKPRSPALQVDSLRAEPSLKCSYPEFRNLISEIRRKASK